MVRLKKMISEIIILISGVLIALFINNWKQKIDNQNFVEKVYAFIEKEMESNSNSISEVLPNHYLFLDSINFYMDKEVPISKILDTNLQAALINNVAWNSFLDSNLELVDFDIVLFLAGLEELERSLNLKFENLRGFLVSNMNSVDKKDKETFVSLLQDIIGSEEQLVEYYKAYLAEYKKEQIEN